MSNFDKNIVERIDLFINNAFKRITSVTYFIPSLKSSYYRLNFNSFCSTRQTQSLEGVVKYEYVYVCEVVDLTDSTIIVRGANGTMLNKWYMTLCEKHGSFIPIESDVPYSLEIKECIGDCNNFIMFFEKNSNFYNAFNLQKDEENKKHIIFSVWT